MRALILPHFDVHGQVTVRGFRIFERQRVLHTLLRQLDFSGFRAVLVDLRVGTFAEKSPAQVLRPFGQQEIAYRVLRIFQRRNQVVFSVRPRKFVGCADVKPAAFVEFLRDGRIEYGTYHDVRYLAYHRDDLRLVRRQVELGRSGVTLVREGGFAVVARFDGYLVFPGGQVKVGGHVGGGFVFADQTFGRATLAVRFDFVQPQRADGQCVVFGGFGLSPVSGNIETQLQHSLSVCRQAAVGIAFTARCQRQRQAGNQRDDGIDMFFHLRIVVRLIFRYIQSDSLRIGARRIGDRQTEVAVAFLVQQRQQIHKSGDVER